MKLYEVFYNFVVAWFPTEIVTQYEDILQFFIVGFVLFTVFGFMFWLFRVIRRLFGFRS